MKKSGILNKRLNEVIASLGHLDTLVVCDAGLPIPHEGQRVDLAFVPGTPGQMEVLTALLNEIVVESVVIAVESKELNHTMYRDIINLLHEHDIHDIQYVPHTEFKERSKQSKAIVRTGEFTPYSNVMLVCGCAY